MKNLKNIKVFLMKEEHLKLLKNMQVRWDDCEFGAPAIDCKRPYGNSDTYKDIANIIGIKGKGSPDEDLEDDESFSKEEIDLMNTLHKETEIALQIVLFTGKFEPGIYVANEYYNDWVKEGL